LFRNGPWHFAGFVSRSDGTQIVRKWSKSISGKRSFVAIALYRDSSQKKSYFKIEDIPYHELRLYLEGNNTPARPWHIGTALDQQVRSKYDQDSKMSLIIPRLFREINEISQYSRLLRSVLFCVKLTYYPFGLLLASMFRENKAKKIRNAIMLKFKV